MTVINKTKTRLSRQKQQEINYLEKNIPKIIRHQRQEINFSVILVSQSRMQKINNKYRNNNSPTDVLAFRDRYKYTTSASERAYIGELYICQKIAKNQQHVPQVSEIIFLVVHGVLHLLGFDHETQKNRKVMFPLQDKILNTLINNNTATSPENST